MKIALLLAGVAALASPAHAAEAPAARLIEDLKLALMNQ